MLYFSFVRLIFASICKKLTLRFCVFQRVLVKGNCSEKKEGTTRGLRLNIYTQGDDMLQRVVVCDIKLMGWLHSSSDSSSSTNSSSSMATWLQ